MDISKFLLEPFVRLLFLVMGITGTILIKDITILSCFYLIVIIPVFIYAGQIRKHLQLLLLGILPILLSFILLYVIILKGTQGNLNFIILKVLKLLLFTSIAQLALTIPSVNLIATFKKWGLKHDALITVLGAFTVWEDVQYRANKIVDARFATGIMGKRTMLNKAKQLPYIIIPLVISIIRTSIDRAECWEQKNIILLVDRFETDKVKYPIVLNVIFLAVSILWIFLALIQ